jgi:signal transduction histidine kinase
MTGGMLAASVPLFVGLLISGGILYAGGARLVGVVLLLTGVLAGVTLLAYARGATGVAEHLLVASVAVGGALAVAAYPRVRRRPGDVGAIALVVVVGVTATAFTSRATVVSALGLTSCFLLIALEWWRYETGDVADRRAVLWLLLAAGSSGLVFGHAVFLLSQQASLILGVLVFAVVAPAMAVGLRRSEVVDVRGLIVQAVVFAVAVVAYVAIFVGVVALLDWFGSPRPPVGLLAVLGALAASTFHPLRIVLRGVVDELLFGDRPDPLDAATRVAGRIGDDPVLALEAIREALVLPYASLWVDGLELATSGVAVTHVRRLPLPVGADSFGEVVVGLRPGDLALSAGDERVLRIVAPLLAQTLRARALADDLQESRGQAIATVEEERRRLRRDLHDGLGPTLSGIAFTADAARNTLRSEPDLSDELLRRLRADAIAAIGEIRRLVYAMRPPALDELGLVPALRQRAAAVRAATGRAMTIAVEVPDQLPTLPAAVEVAAYRIVLEALTNTARHSGTDLASVRLDVVDGGLFVEVRDGGRTAAPWVAGVGLASMRERAAEVGGTLDAFGGPTGGVVSALLPLPARSSPGALAEGHGVRQ